MTTTREEALRVVRGVDWNEPFAVLNTASFSVVGETRWAWIVGCALEGDPLDGIGALLVDKESGALHIAGSGKDALRSLEWDFGKRPRWKFWGATSLWDATLYFPESWSGAEDAP